MLRERETVNKQNPIMIMIKNESVKDLLKCFCVYKLWITDGSIV